MEVGLEAWTIAHIYLYIDMYIHTYACKYVYVIPFFAHKQKKHANGETVSI